jgi:hypothetical protein
MWHLIAPGHNLVWCHASWQTLGLEHFELLLERALDTRVLLAWGPDAVVLSFRGTSSWTNLKADLSAWLTGGACRHRLCLASAGSNCILLMCMMRMGVHMAYDHMVLRSYCALWARH